MRGDGADLKQWESWTLTRMSEFSTHGEPSHLTAHEAQREKIPIASRPPARLFSTTIVWLKLGTRLPGGRLWLH